MLEVLGQGGFGIVLRAFDERLERVVAIKVMTPEIAATSPAEAIPAEARSPPPSHKTSSVYAVERPIPYLVMGISRRTLQAHVDATGFPGALTMLRYAVQITPRRGRSRVWTNTPRHQA